MSGAFDGTRKSSEDPSFKAPLIMLLVLVVVIVVLLLVASGALEDAGIDSPINNQTVPSASQGF